MPRSFLLALLLLLFSCTSSQAYTLSKIPPSDVGPKIASIPGNSGGTSSGAALIDAIVETTISVANNKPLQAGAGLALPLVVSRSLPYVGTAFALGYTAYSAYDLYKAYSNNWLQQKPELNNVINQTFPGQPTTQGGYNNSNVACSTAYSQCQPGLVAHLEYVNTSQTGGWYNTTSGQATAAAWMAQFPKFTAPNVYLVARNLHVVGSYLYADLDNYNVTYISGEPTTWGAPQSLTAPQMQQLADALANAFASNPAIKTALDNIAQSHPDVITLPPPLTQQDINNWANTTNYNTNQEYISNLTNLAETYQGDTYIQNELAKAQAEQEKEEAEDIKDTYDPISSSGFAEPYNPGEYDIPARFTSFLNTVKSSGLFSFSSGFFNSLPGGGSPVYEIEGGQTFGHHSIDLSQTLSTGLAVLKTVLLACFGFLSIRAVIMKR